ncbi:hypothetical protein GCM10010282_50400 [Streptomyces roseolus]|nr:hypothetical protein GCM10010282_50400 [Streptomyces roseolus]
MTRHRRPPTASPLVPGGCRRPTARRPRCGGVDDADRRYVIATVPCPCDCHTDSAVALYGSVIDALRADCTECEGTGRIIVDSAVIDAVREAEAEVARAAVPDTFKAPDLCTACEEQGPCADPGAGCIVTPPCCFQPQLCGGPHEDCPEALRAAEACEAVLSTPDAKAGEHTCDAPHPYCSLDGHADVPDTTYRCDHVLPLCPGGGCCPPDEFCRQCR